MCHLFSAGGGLTINCNCSVLFKADKRLWNNMIQQIQAWVYALVGKGDLKETLDRMGQEGQGGTGGVHN